MDTIKIGTLNTQNNKINRSGGLTTDGMDNSVNLAQHIENIGYYFLSTQELTRVFSDKLMKNLEHYKLYGGYRYGSSKLVKKIKVLDDFNENNAIITNRNVKDISTNLLPWFPNNPRDLMSSLKHGSIMPRIVTSTLITDEVFGDIYAINTHLDYQLKSVQLRQLKNIYKMISILSKEYQMVLTGDFNMEVNNDEHFDEFILGLEQLGLKRVEVNDKTNSDKFENKTAIDHIFIPKRWTVENAGLINDESLNNLTDHKGVFADIKVR